MCRVMIVDDSAFMRTLLKNMIINAGYRVVAEAKNGMEAINLYGIYHPDVVTMDLTMPIMGGLEALKILTALHSNVKVIVVSAMGQTQIINEAIRSGARGFLVKPFEFNKVVDEISVYLKRGE